MSNDYYVSTGAPVFGSFGQSVLQSNQFTGVEQGFDKIPDLTSLLRGISYYATTGGVANTYTAAVSSKVTAYVDHLRVSLKMNLANTGASTINVNALGAKQIRRQDGSQLVAADLPINVIAILTYNTSDGYFTFQGTTTSQYTEIAANVATASAAAVTATNAADVAAAAAASMAGDYLLTGTEVVASNGGIQTKTIAGATVLTNTLTNGQAVALKLLGATPGDVTITGVVWVGLYGESVPTWTGADWVLLIKSQGVLYGWYSGEYTP